MEIKIEKTAERQVTLILAGRLDTSVAAAAEREIKPLYDYFEQEIVIDRSEERRVGKECL